MRFDDESQLHHLADHECEHGALPDDKVLRCDCWAALIVEVELMPALRDVEVPA